MKLDLSSVDYPHRIVRAWLNSTSSGVIALDADWQGDALPLLAPGEPAFAFANLGPAAASLYAEEAAYYVDEAGQLVFVLDPADYSWIDFKTMPVYVAGSFNGWAAAIGQPEWRLQLSGLNGRPVWLGRTRAAPLLTAPPQQFKFITAEGRWLELPREASNGVSAGQGYLNRAIFPHRTGRNLFQFTTIEPLLLTQTYSVIQVRDGRHAPKTRLRLGKFFHELSSPLPMGAQVHQAETTFRLFAPRAKYVRLFLCEKLTEQEHAFGYELDRRDEAGRWSGVWEAHLDRNLHGWYYWYSINGPHDFFGHFQPSHKVLDPYAQAAVGPAGPGVVLDPAWVGRGDRSWATPPWQDLVIAEAHVRDLVAHAPLPLAANARLGFAGLTQWVNHPDFYLKKLGVNAVELQPIHEHDARHSADYHWGYMTTNFFAPASGYGLVPGSIQVVKEFQALVAAFHRQGIAVIIDVVYNHVGEPPHLQLIDKLYYFELDDQGQLTNSSGCGNDVRCRSAMATRLISDSLIHLIEVYGVDGFRFDLAELIGVDVLRTVEAAVKKVKADVILIAEPWSFRGHSAAALRSTGYTSWNDGYRDFLRAYVHGRGTAEKMEYFLKGSPWHFAYWPAQTVNYTESHDDRTWVDMITERGDHNGFDPTPADRQRTHLMAAILLASIGIPLLAAGQDFLRSKYGVTNTYQRGDLNALDYHRRTRFAATQQYFADWVAFRRSPRGHLLRQWSRPSEGFFQCIAQLDGPALVAIYNADGSQGPERILLALNPHRAAATIALGKFADWNWRPIADQESFYEAGQGRLMSISVDLCIPALGCSLWVTER